MRPSAGRLQQEKNSKENRVFSVHQVPTCFLICATCDRMAGTGNLCELIKNVKLS